MIRLVNAPWSVYKYQIVALSFLFIVYPSIYPIDSSKADKMNLQILMFQGILNLVLRKIIELRTTCEVDQHFDTLLFHLEEANRNTSLELKSHELAYFVLRLNFKQRKHSKEYNQ